MILFFFFLFKNEINIGFPLFLSPLAIYILFVLIAKGENILSQKINKKILIYLFPIYINNHSIVFSDLPMVQFL